MIKLPFNFYGRTKTIISFVGIVFVAFWGGYFTHFYMDYSGFTQAGSLVQVRENSPAYKYINPLLFVSNNETLYPELDSLKRKMEKNISVKINDGDASEASVYFREMDTGRWTGVGEDKLYSPSSMLKVATLIAYLRSVSKNPNKILDKIYYKYNEDPGQLYKPVPLETGYYSGPDLLKQMIIYSDNTAMILVNRDITSQILNLYEELELPSILVESDDFMSPRLYSRFFRTLYNATYISRSYSEQALNLLTHTNFDEGLKKGVSKEIEVAHKFGEHTLMQNGVIKYRELHDCGIVYYPNNPYFICIMTKGNDFKKLEKVIADLSKIVYDYQNKS